MSEELGTSLRRWTDARVALGRSGGSLPHRALLDFRLAHARARDAVHLAFDPAALALDLESLGLPLVLAPSQAPDRASYLQRPDLGRRLSPEAEERLAGYRRPEGFDLALIVSDGLSAEAAHTQTRALLAALLPLLREWSLAPIVIAPFARVALQDEIGGVLGARAAMILLGERPGLGSPDSLGAYLVHSPRPGNTDADRNCVSNIRAAGLVPEVAALRIRWLLEESRRLGFSGVDLKDSSGGLPGADRLSGECGDFT
jgi:ethanolamine ammonia-lyase small subunit